MRRLLAPLLLALAVGTASADVVRPGERAPGFALEDWAGKRVALADLAGQVVCIDFWATWCATCKEALPALDAMARRHRDAGVRFVAISLDRDRKQADRFLAERLPEPAMTMLHDPSGGVLARYGASGMPALYVIDRDGVVRHLEAGYAPAALARVEQKLDDLLKAGR